MPDPCFPWHLSAPTLLDYYDLGSNANEILGTGDEQSALRILPHGH
jgi:hypothetical protein